tara:strand:+ start:207 stop:569 length:363 start_codon:yes stop_codon:yes gene_type:complete
MKIFWERNSKVRNLLNQGKISDEDVLSKRSTSDFPNDAATVRIQGLTNKNPLVSVHIRGEEFQRTFVGGMSSWNCTPVMRVNMGSEWYEDTHGLSGELPKGVSFLDVHNVITKVRKTLGL